MLFKVSPDIFRNYPSTKIGLIVAHNINNSSSTEDLKKLLQETQEKVKAELTPEKLTQHPHITPWLEAYKKFGSNPKKHIPSVKNLVERLLKKGSIPSINPLVDLYNIISLKYLLPAGGEDLETIQGDIQLTIAGTDEAPALLLGEVQPSTPEAREVFYKDNAGAICRRWNWREADRTKLTPQTKHAFLVLEGLSSVDQPLLEMAINELALLIQHYCGGTVSIAFVNEKNAEVELKNKQGYTTLQAPTAITTPCPEIYKKEAIAEEPASHEHEIRVEKIEKMRQEGIEPWPVFKPVSITAIEAIEAYKVNPSEAVHTIAGRLMMKRDHGKTFFGVLQDRSGQIQIYIKKDDVGETNFEQFKKYSDIGDIIWVQGPLFVTKMGEITVKVEKSEILSKCLHPLPEKFHGLSDVEQRYRQRYLDLISNPESKNKFKKRSTIVQAIRNFLYEKDFIEAETPMLHPIPGGATARPFVTHHNAYDMQLFLRIAPELYLKRLVVGGFERVFEINRNFRNEGVSTRHNPEFTMLEFYMAHGDYKAGMELTEQIIQDAVLRNFDSLKIEFQDKLLDFTAPFKRLSIKQSLIEIAKFDASQVEEKNIDALIKTENVTLAGTASYGVKLFALFEHAVESKIVNPTFITDYPVEVSPLAKRDDNNPEVTARFELFVAGMELANGFSELNDPFDQAERFKGQVASREAGDSEAHHFDGDYIKTLEYALPPTVGVGIGIDRLAMLLTNTSSIKDVILFPTLKQAKE